MIFLKPSLSQASIEATTEVSQRAACSIRTWENSDAEEQEMEFRHMFKQPNENDYGATENYPNGCIPFLDTCNSELGEVAI